MTNVPWTLSGICAARISWAFSSCSFPKSSAVSGAAPSTCIACVKRWRASIWASPRRCWPRSSAAIRSRLAPRRSKRNIWLSRIAEEGLLFAYGATEPNAGSDLGALESTADRIMQDGKIVGYKINGSKQWISERWDCRCLYDFGEHARRSQLVHRRKGRAGFQARRAGR